MKQINSPAFYHKFSTAGSLETFFVQNDDPQSIDATVYRTVLETEEDGLKNIAIDYSKKKIIANHFFVNDYFETENAALENYIRRVDVHIQKSVATNGPDAAIDMMHIPYLESEHGASESHG